jgi:hypothetical protein
LEKLPSDERRDEFANELLKLPSKDVWDSWNKLSDDEKAKLPLAGAMMGGNFEKMEGKTQHAHSSMSLPANTPF